MRITTAAAASFVTSAPPPLAVARAGAGPRRTNSMDPEQQDCDNNNTQGLATPMMEDEAIIGESESGSINCKIKSQDKKDTKITSKGYTTNVLEVGETLLQEETKGAEKSISIMEEEPSALQEEAPADTDAIVPMEVEQHVNAKNANEEEEEGLEDYSHASQFIGTGVSMPTTPTSTDTTNAVVASQSEGQGPPQAQAQTQTQQHTHGHSDSAAIVSNRSIPFESNSNLQPAALQQQHQHQQHQQQHQQYQQPHQQHQQYQHPQHPPPTQSSTINTHAAANVSSMLEAAGFGIGHGGGGHAHGAGGGGGAGHAHRPHGHQHVGQQQHHTTYSSDSPEFQWSERTKRLAKDLEEFVERGLDGIMASERGDVGAPSEEAVADLQLQTARMLRTVRLFHLLFFCS